MRKPPDINYLAEQKKWQVGKNNVVEEHTKPTEISPNASIGINIYFTQPLLPYFVAEPMPTIRQFNILAGTAYI